MGKGNLENKIDILDVQSIRKATAGSTLADDLRPTRTTFRLSRHCTESVRSLASWIGITEKEVIDSYTEGVPVILTHFGSDSAKSAKENAVNMKDIFRDLYVADLDRERKTRVVSTKTLRTLDQLATGFDISRDSVLEVIIQYGVIIEEIKRVATLKRLKEARMRLENIINHCRQELDDIHDLVRDSGLTIHHYDRLLEEEDLRDIESKIELYESVSLSAWRKGKGESEKDEQKEKGEKE